MGAQSDPDRRGNPERSKPRMFGSHIGSGELPWTWATERLNRARNYWIATTRSNGTPHSRPIWGIWLDNAFYFSTGSLAASNLSIHSAITVHLESGSEVVIIEGIAIPVNDEDLVERVVSQYNQKYNWNLDPHNLPGPFYAVYTQVAFGWYCKESDLLPESSGLETATRWKF